MSKVGRAPIEIPSDATVTLSGDTVTIKGSLATFERKVPSSLAVTIDGNILTVELKDAENRQARKMWGTLRALLLADIIGATKGYEKQLIAEGVGYHFAVQGQKLTLSMGFSHDVDMEIPQGITAELKKNTLTLKGANKEQLGQFAANVRAVKKPEPYLGKGIRYSDEHVRRKEGKKAGADEAK